MGLDDHKSNFLLANEYLDFMEFLRDEYMDTEEFKEMLEKFEEWKNKESR